jgi:predicted dehydrogenase
VGVIGLGRRWRRRFRPALRALRGQFSLAAVCDQAAARARQAGRRLRCAAAAGPTELLERPDVDVLLLADPQWYGLWPLEAACRVGKPVFCGFPAAHDEAHAERVGRAVREANLPVMVAHGPPFPQTLTRLRDLLANELGTPRLLLGTVMAPAGGGAGGAACSLCPGFTSLLGWCAFLLEGEPRRVLAAGPEGGLATTVLLDYGHGRAAQLTRVRVPAGRQAWRVQVVADRGTGTAEPGQVRWRGPDGEHSHALGRRRPAAEVMMEAFRRALAEGRPPQPGLDEAQRLLGWLRLAARSRAEAGWVSLSP